MKYYLLCAGEDSGDVLGESFVAAVMAAGFAAHGTGGARMQSAGLQPLADYEDLPVSGFGDVLPHYFRLRRAYATLRGALMHPDCVGLVAIDYPGFNMRRGRSLAQANCRGFVSRFSSVLNANATRHSVAVPNF